MKILLAPSETKRAGGSGAFELQKLLFETLNPIRKKILDKYVDILRSNDTKALSKMFGLKKQSDILYHASKNILGDPVMRAVERYTGVAFDHLDYPSLDKSAREYLHKNLIIHSNLFGFLRSDDLIPEYRLKQGEPVGELIVEKLYREMGTSLMDEYLKGEDILDLRAGFYDRFYKPSRPYTVLKFLKGDKVVSHWAKAYRGLVLRAIAQSGTENIEGFMKLPVQGLSIEEIQTRGLRTEIIYRIEA